MSGVCAQIIVFSLSVFVEMGRALETAMMSFNATRLGATAEDERRSRGCRDTGEGSGDHNGKGGTHQPLIMCRANRSDLAFILDCTGSMQRYINSVRDHIFAMCDMIRGEQGLDGPDDLRVAVSRSGHVPPFLLSGSPC